MKFRTILGLAAASTLAWSAGANAAWFGHGNTNGDQHFSFFHGKHAASSMWNGYEVQTPSQVNESAPWKANEPHMAGPIAYSSTTTYSSLGDVSYGTGASSNVSGYGSGGFASSDTMRYNDMSIGTTIGRPYWMLDE